MINQVIMCYLGEVTLKGLNKATFESQIIKTIKNRIESVGNFKVYKAQSIIYIAPEDDNADIDEAYERVKKIFGIANVSKSAVCDKDFDTIADLAPKYLSEELKNAKSFKVSAKRADKTYPMTSVELAMKLGDIIGDMYPELEVDVHHPDVNVTVEIRDFGAYIHGTKQPGAGGMPVGTSGKGALMLSGGIDSPVAAYMMAKRGMTITAVHFASPPYTGQRAKQKVITLCDKLKYYTGNIRLFVVPFTEPQEYIRDNGVEELFTILMRRSMLRITQQIAEKNGAMAIITGESLGQVASQTLNAMVATDNSVSMPVFRPLIGMDKIEITAIARRIDTFETSILPYEDCCTIFTPAHPKTKPSLDEVLNAEQRMDMEALLRLESTAAKECEIIDIKL